MKHKYDIRVEEYKEFLKKIKEDDELFKYKDFWKDRTDFKERNTRDYKDIKKTLDGLGVHFFAILGTCLGAVREGDFIEWDDDIDLGVFTDIDINIIAEEFRKQGFQATISLTNFLNLNRYTNSDILFLKRFGDKLSIQENFSSEKNTESLIYDEKMFRKFKETKLGDNTILIPDPAEPYLESYYGDWRTPKYQPPHLYIPNQIEL